MSRILIISTAADRMGDSGNPTGVWLEELARPWMKFIDAGHDVTLATLGGRPVPVDPNSEPGDDEQDLTDFREAHQETLAAPKALSSVEAEGWDAVFIPGGHGAMWDLASSEEVAAFLAKAWDSGAIVSSVCHGPAALVGVTVDGAPLVKGRKVNAFTDSEERGVGLDGVVPFMLETRLRDLGARFEVGPDNQPHAVRDGRLVTGQNPFSSAPVADLVLDALKEG